MRKIEIKNKKGSAMDVLIWMILGFGTIVFLGLWLYMTNTWTNLMDDVPGTAKVNVSDAFAKTLAPVNAAQNTWVPIIGYMLLFGSALSILVSSFLVKAHPAFFIVYVIITIAAIVCAVYLSNYYEDLMQDPIFGPTFQTRMRGGSFILLNLPHFVTVIGLFGAIFLFAGILRDKGTGGGIG